MDGIIERLEREGRANRKPREKNPEKVRVGKRAKRRGYEAEKKVERILADYGFVRVPLSGSLGGKLSGDLIRRVMFCPGCGRKFYSSDPLNAEGETCLMCGNILIKDKEMVEKIEVKERKDGFRSLRKWLKSGDILVLDPGRDEPMAVMPLTLLKYFLYYAEKDVFK